MEDNEKKQVLIYLSKIQGNMQNLHSALLNSVIDAYALKKYIETGVVPETVDIPLSFVSIPPTNLVKNKNIGKKNIVQEQKEKIVELLETSGSLFLEEQTTKSNVEDNINMPITGDPEVF